MTSLSKISLVIFLCVSASIVSAQTVVCERQRLSSDGFVSVQAAKSWYPEEIWFRIDGNTAESFAGEATVEPEGNRFILTHNLGGTYYKIRYIPSHNRASAWITTSGYVPTIPTSYRCAEQ